MSSDVTVFGLLVPTCVLHDIGMDVPHGETVVIPAEKAQRSKDLWRSIGQKQIFRLMQGPQSKKPFPPLDPHILPIPDRTKELEAENQALKTALSTQAAKLDTILSLLQAGIPLSALTAAPRASTAPVSQVVGGEAPAFIPSSITPENSEARIEPKRAEVDNTDVSGAAGKLRELRQKGKQ